MTRFVVPFALLAFSSTLAPAGEGSKALAATSSADAPHVSVELLSEFSSVRPGSPTTVGIRFELERDWHVYWQNPGDSGEAVRATWTLPESVTAGPIEWPSPRRFPVGPLVNFGYAKDVLLPVTLALPGSLKAGGRLPVRVKAKWLVCKEECIPGAAELALDLPVLATTPKPSPAAPHFVEAREARPLPMPEGWTASVTATIGGFDLVVDRGTDTSLPAIHDAYFFPETAGTLAHAAVQTLTTTDGRMTLALVADENLAAAPARLPGVLALNGRHFAIDTEVTSTALAAQEPPVTMAYAMLLAILGGLILNAMPCVFPVLSIKAVGLLSHAHENQARARTHGLLYGLGVLVSFWVLAGTLLVLRAGGAKLGWGFQLQSPGAILALALLLFAMGLNLAGLFEIRAGWVGIGQGLASRREAVGAFFTGVLATIVATPCTAPFMGTALGFAAAQPAAVALAIFTALALGLAAPYVLLSWFPRAGRLLPKPGRWMETMKQVLAFPLFATVIWLLWVLGQQKGVGAVAGGLAACLFVALAGWVYERWQQRGGIIATTIALALAAFLAIKLGAGSPNSAKAETTAGWTTFTPAALAAMRAQGAPVFLDFTAAWCVTCKVNEMVALGPATLEDMRARGVTPMQADWTNEDPEITAALASFGRNGVPLYVLYGGKNQQPTILPQILTASIVREALDKVTSSQQ